MTEQSIFLTLGLSLGLGLLVGLQREHAQSNFGGIRTFPLVALTGTMLGLLHPYVGPWPIAAGLLALTGLIIVANFLQKKTSETHDVGQTSEMSALLMYLIGVYLAFGSLMVGVALGSLVAVLLHFKLSLHALVKRFDPKDLKVVMQFALISLVILPVLPDETYGPYEVLNPHDIWLMVVLIVGISISGYFAYKFFGEKAGAFLGGILGGLISSTATTVSYARRTKSANTGIGLAAFVIITASAVSLLRIIVELAVVAPSYFGQLATPVASVLAVLVLMVGILYHKNRNAANELPEQDNPAQLKSALVFGGLYALVLFASAAAKDYFGSQGLYAVAFISGLTDVDAITLSVASMVQGNQLKADIGWKLVLLAAVSNLFFKGGLVFSLGGKKLALQIGFWFGIAIAAGVVVLFLWPEEWFF